MTVSVVESASTSFIISNKTQGVVQLYRLANDGFFVENSFTQHISAILKNEDLEMWFLSQPPNQVSSFSPGFFIKPVLTILQVRKVLHKC